MNTADLFLSHLKSKIELTLWGKEVSVYNFPTCTAVPWIYDAIENDVNGLREQEIRPGDVILDIGANIGLFTIAAAQAYPEAHIYAVEAMPHNYKNLCLNLQENGITNVTATQVAIAGHNGKLSLTQHPTNSGGGTIHHLVDGFPQFEVTCLTLSEYLRLQGISRVRFLKMDIEGSEYAVLNSFEEWEKIDAMGLEIHEDPVHERSRALAEVDALCERVHRYLGARAKIVGEPLIPTK